MRSYRMPNWLIAAAVFLIVGGCAAPTAAPPPPVSPPAAGTATPRPAAPPKLEKVKAQITAPGAPYLQLHVGKDKGIFKEEGIDLELVVMASTLVPPALIAGEIDYDMVFIYSMYGGMKGLGTRAIMIILKGPAWHIYAAPGISSFEELKGKAVAATRVGSLSYYVMGEVLKMNGVASKDFTFVSVSSGADQVAALMSKSVAAAPLISPYDLKAKELGMKELLFTGAMLELPSGGMGTTVKKIKENPEQVKRMIRANLKSMKYVKEHPEETIAFMMKEFGLDRTGAKASYDEFVILVSPDGSFTEKGLQNLIDAALVTGQLTKEQAQVPVERGIDTTLLKEVQKELGLAR